MPTKPKIPRQPPRQQLVGAMVPKVSLPLRGSLSVRATFHSVPVDLPPPSSLSNEVRIFNTHTHLTDPSQCSLICFKDVNDINVT